MAALPVPPADVKEEEKKEVKKEVKVAPPLTSGLNFHDDLRAMRLHVALAATADKDVSSDVIAMMMKHLGPHCTGKMWKGLLERYTVILSYQGEAAIDVMSSIDAVKGLCIFVLDYLDAQVDSELKRTIPAKKAILPLPEEKIAAA